MIPYSLLDLSPVPEGKTTAEALQSTLELAPHAEALGYNRYWLAEHHGMVGIASAATAVLIGQVAAVTKTIRVGAGGIMLPNHAPMVVAEQFGTLAELFPGRIDLGLGRAPGSDRNVMRALRRGMEADRFPEDVVELMGFLGEAQPGHPVRAIPGEGTNVPVWILGSSLYGAQLAAHLGLPYAFASHFAPDALGEALTIYRDRFRPGITDKPHAMMAVNVIAAETDAEAARLFTSVQQAFLNMIHDRRGKLPAPIDDITAVAGPAALAQIGHMLRITATGGPGTVKAQLGALIDEFRPDEVMLAGQIHDLGARKRSFEIAAEAMRALAPEAAA
ncbi:LLM class flavin-dependent oxidoreductase [Mesobacterium pallidum]|uniref:LLM class flavin-dependent oxidoreductase n=1 Tax=Mesobacterium pallidum TaxID=2872037 RepID=UPI001EE234FF|nr:LLM class flavin-dependent oxidoreductase [Mesobacterium pallidum]